MNFWETALYILRVIFLPNSLRTMEWKMLKLVNKDRKAHGLLPLRMQDDLRAVARKHSRDMARKDYFEHQNLRGQTPFDRLEDARVTDIVAGENLAKIRGYQNPVVRAEIGLMNSPGHRANILNDSYNTVGIGIIKSSNKTFYYTQNFAKRDIVFSRKIPKKISLKNGLRLCGDVFTSVDKILYQVKMPNQVEKVLEGLIDIRNKKFDSTVIVKDIGIYNVFIYTNIKNQPGKFKIANKFEIKVQRSFLW